MSLEVHIRTHAPDGARLVDQDHFGLQSPARKAIAAPSRNSTCFSALTMTSSDDYAFDSTRDGVQHEDFGIELGFSSDEVDLGELAASTVLSLTHENALPELSFDTEQSETESAPDSADCGETESEADSLTLDDFGSDQDDLGRGLGAEEASSEMSWSDPDADYVLPRQARAGNRPDEHIVDGFDNTASSNNRASPPPAKRRKIHDSHKFGQDEERAAAGAAKVFDSAAMSAGATSAPRSPTQAEMDAFFGFVDPLAPSHPDGAPARGSDVKSPVEPAKHQAVGTANREIAPVKLSLAREPEPRPRTRRGAETSTRSPTLKRYYQLEPIPSISPNTGRALTEAEKRSHIVVSLERVALSVLQQIADHVLPRTVHIHASESSEGSDGASGALQRAAADSLQPITVVLAKRGRPERTASGAKQSLKYPRKYGKGDEVRLGCRELAVFVRVVQMLLDGLSSAIVSTKRDLYYRDVNLFRKQLAVDTIIDDIAATLRVRRSDLGVVATSKGLFAGAVQLVVKDGSTLSGAQTPGLIPPGQAIQWVVLDEIRWILVVEKDAVFTTLHDAGLLRNAELGNGVLITGKGYPDVASRELVKRLTDCAPHVPLFALVDCDPYGLDILSTYRFGSSAQAHEANHLAAPSLRWLGLRLADAAPRPNERDKLLPLKSADRLKAHSLLSRKDLPQSWRRELARMLHLGYKAETEILAEGDAYMRRADDEGVSTNALVTFVWDKLRQALNGIGTE